MKSYQNAKSYRAALEQKILGESKNSGKDIARLRKATVFDVFLERLNKGRKDFILKGGYALELRLDVARSTKDLDFGMAKILRAMIEGPGEKIDAAILSILETAMEVTTGGADDFFQFRLESTRTMDEVSAYRFKVSSLLDGRVFENFIIDIGIGDEHGAEETLKKKSLAKIGAQSGEDEFDIAIIRPERQYAEKIHAYTLPRERENTRVKDLVDLYLLIKMGVGQALIKDALKEVFNVRKTHQIPDNLEMPPKSWDKPFKQLASECGIDQSITEVFRIVALHYNEL